MNIVLYTAIFGGVDPLWSLPPIPTQAARVCFTDAVRPEIGSWGGRPYAPRQANQIAAQHCQWEQVVAVSDTLTPRRLARYYKLLPRLAFPDADVWLWVDGNVRLRVSPEEAVARWLGDADLVTLHHPDRGDLYAEVTACIAFGKDDADTLTAQAAAYRAAGHPAGWGLAETRVVIRRNTPAIRALNAAWWAELVAHSCRDQVALPFVCWQQGLRWATLPGRVIGDRHPQIWHSNTKHPRPKGGV